MENERHSRPLFLIENKLNVYKGLTMKSEVLIGPGTETMGHPQTTGSTGGF
jgi:hypothetical protein